MSRLKHTLKLRMATRSKMVKKIKKVVKSEVTHAHRERDSVCVP